MAMKLSRRTLLRGAGAAACGDGTLAALLYSLWGMVVGSRHLYFETGAVIAALILLGPYFEARSRRQAGDTIEKLMQLGAKTARVVRDGEEQDIPIEQV